ncbi:hypothetical protein SAMN05428950_1011347 [Sphingomonas sp. OV641]|nr:hypothetical protein SAMN05428950_1011347 [Sphingomonas sp. OV641]
MMDRDLARIVIGSAFRASRELTELVPLLKEHDDQSEDLRLGLASAIAEIGQAVLNPLFEAFPDMEAETDNLIERYGRAI